MRRIIIWIVVLAVAGGGGWYYLSHRAPQTAQQAGGRRRPDQPDPVPVLVAAVTRQDVPIYLEGLGTVQAFNSVIVKTMVDGPLVEVRFREGQDVRTGDVLARIDPRPYQATLDQAVAKKAQDEANLANARVDLVRYTKLAQTAYSSAQQADTQRATVAQLEAQVRQDQASIDSARTQLSYCTIVSPLDGRTGIRQVDQGNIVHAGDTTPLTVIAQLQPITVAFTLPQQALPSVVAAMRGGDAQVLALPQGATSGTTPPLDHGTLTVLDNQVDATTGTIKLKAAFPNADLRLWPGGFVNVRLLIDTQRDQVVVPPVAVQRGPSGAYVYIVADGKTATRRPVTLGHEDDQVVVIAEGLTGGERVVVDGASRLTDKAVILLADPSGAPTVAAPPATSRAATPGTAARRGRQRTADPS